MEIYDMLLRMLPTLALLLLFLGIVAFGATFFTHMILGVPFVPTRRRIAKTMMQLADVRPGQTVIDLGAGDGRLLIAALRHQPSIRAIGVELLPTVWMLGWLRKTLSRRPIDWRLGNALTADVRGANIVFLYVAPHLMARLEEKFDRELQPGTVVISNTFGFPRRMPERIDHAGGKPVMRYVWS